MDSTSSVLSSNLSYEANIILLILRSLISSSALLDYMLDVEHHITEHHCILYDSQLLLRQLPALCGTFHYQHKDS